jgi:hypothetical protein
VTVLRFGLPRRLGKKWSQAVAIRDADDCAEGWGRLEAAMVLEHLVGLGSGDGYLAGMATREVAPPEEAAATHRRGWGARSGEGDQSPPSSSPGGARPASGPPLASPQCRREGGFGGGGGAAVETTRGGQLVAS